MVGRKGNFIALVVVILVLGHHLGAEVHHRVGDEKGWDSNNNVASWSSGRLFKVGDVIWFTYDAAQESVVELESIGEFASCDVKNPIKMYTEGLNKVELDEEGTRFFASGNPENCNKGLKIHVNVHPKDHNPSSQGEDLSPPYFPTPPYGPGGKDVPDVGPYVPTPPEPRPPFVPTPPGPGGKDEPDVPTPPEPRPPFFPTPPGPGGKDEPDVPTPPEPRPPFTPTPPGPYVPTPPEPRPHSPPPPSGEEPPYPSGSGRLVGLGVPFGLLMALLLCSLGF